MSRPKSWREMREWQVELLERSGRSLAEWNADVAALAPADEASLRGWLSERGVTGYAQMLLVHERFGYPDFLLRSADELVDAQYADRPDLRPVHEAVLTLLGGLPGEVTVQTRKTYTALVSPRRTFAVLAPTTRTRVDLGFRWTPPGPLPERLSAAGGRLGGAMEVKVGLGSPDDVDDEVAGWLGQAYAANV